ncbi:MAG: hypothetical protein U9Q04_03520 [Campylobacterota bacterium]|nr:hypothetical protein [Campylobacterota bacterium]
MKHLKSLLKLKENKELNYSQLPNTLIKELLEEDLIVIKTITPKRKKIIVKEQFYKVYKDIEKLQNISTRIGLIESNTHTKKINISPQDGLYINGNCTINDIQLPLFKNSALFLKDIPTISKDITVVGVENYENLIYFDRCLKYFEDTNILFVYRNKAMLELFKTIPNKKIYFCDFDLAGIDIYLHQIIPLGKDIELFIPKNIEQLIKKYGTNHTYKKQLNKYKNLKSENRKIQELIDTIKKYQKGLEQEYFVSNIKHNNI